MCVALPGEKDGKKIKYIVQSRKNKAKFTIEHYAGYVCMFPSDVAQIL